MREIVATYFWDLRFNYHFVTVNHLAISACLR